MVLNYISRDDQRLGGEYKCRTTLPFLPSLRPSQPARCRRKSRGGDRWSVNVKKSLLSSYATSRCGVGAFCVLAVVTTMVIGPRVVSGAAPPACSPSSVPDIFVKSAEDLAGLVGQTNCSDGEFIVSWHGEVVFEDPIVVGNFTSLSIAGVGAGAVLDGGGVARLFEAAEGSTLILENVELRNATAPRWTGGGGAIFSDGAELTVQATSCNFTENTSPVDGGVILSTGGLASISFTDCRFERNFADHSGGVVRVDSAALLSANNSFFLGNIAHGTDTDWDEGDGYGGALYFSGGQPEVDLDGCEFRENNCSHFGGAVSYDAAGRLSVVSTSVSMNRANYGGGGIWANGGVEEVNVVDSVFEDNLVSENSTWSNNVYEGGGLYVFGQALVTVRSSNFSRNGAKSGGGFSMRGNLTVSVEESLFQDNIASSYGGGVVMTTWGNGALEATFTKVTFLRNNCPGYGGAVFSSANGSGNLSFIGTNFVNNSAVYRGDLLSALSAYRGGGYSASGKDLYTLAHSCVFEGNQADAVGGAVSVDGGNFSAINCDFSGNVAYGGGAINAADYLDDLRRFPSEIYVRGGSMRRNIVEHLNCYDGGTNQRFCGHGGALYAELGAEAVLCDVAIVENSAGFGGAISLSTDARASCTSVNFSSNSAAVAGGAVNVWGNNSHFFSETSVFSSNAADARSQGLTSTSSSSGNFTGPTRDLAGASGGAVSVTDRGSVYLTNSAVWSNQADGRGGAVFCGDSSNVTAIGVDFFYHESGVAGHVQAHGGACAAVDGCGLRLVESNFKGNRASAPSGGAVSVEGDSEMLASRCTFSDNHASGGGAVYGSGSDTKITLESCSLVRNRAQKEGGALRAYAMGTLQLESCNFDFNSADELGGGIHCYECDQMTATNCSFEGNRANGDGGAIRLSYASSASITRCRFTENVASYDGGAIAMDAAAGQVDRTDGLDAETQAQNETDSDDDLGDVSLICSSTGFFGNIAGERGGTIYSTTDSQLDLTDCNSTTNNAALGGSLYMSSSHCVLANCLFSGDYNTVSTDATIFAVDSKIQAREVTFSNSYNDSSMLAMYAGSGTTLEAQNCSFVGWSSSNVVLADSTGILQLDACDFSGSMAQSLVSVADGDNVQPAIIRNARLGTANYDAIDYLAGETSIEGNGSTFGSNLAGCDSNPCTEGCEEGDLGVYCACYDNILDFDETCLGSSGALSLTALEKEVYAEYPDEPNTKLRLEGNNTEKEGPVLWKLEWTDDQSSLGWEALPSTGLVYPGESITIFLRGDVAKNWNGESQTVVSAEAPHQDDVESSSVTVNATFVYCGEGDYWDSSVSECISCSLLGFNPEGVVCFEEGMLLETLSLVEGFWRADAASRIIRKCFNDDACVGSDGDRIVTANDYCADGYMGPYCAVCMDGYTIGVSHTCHSCDSRFRAGMVVIMALTGVIMVVGIVMVINDLVGNPALTDLSETHFSAISRRLRKVPFHKLKIPFVVFQIMTQYAAITSIEFPPVFQTFLTAISVINLDLGWLFRAVCIVELNFYGRLLAATIGPFVVLLVLLGTYIYTCKQHGLRPPTREATDHAMFPVIRTSPHSSESDSEYSVLWRVQDKHITVAVTIAFLLYSTVSTVIFQAFTCDELEDINQRYLRADYAIDCDSDKHQSFQIYAGAMILVYPIGIPLVFFILLFRKRRIINPSKEVHPDISGGNGGDNYDSSEGDREPDPRLLDRRIAQTAFLWGAYRPGAYYFEVLECFRRLLLTGCLVFILPNSAGQAAVACVLSVVTVGIFALVHPYSDPNDHMAYTLGALVIFLTMFMGLVVRVDLADEETQSQRVLGALLIVLTVGLLVVAVLDCLWETRRLSSGSGDDGGHIFLRRLETKTRDREKEKEKEQLADERYKTGGALYAPKLLDVPMNRASVAKPEGTVGGLDEERTGAAATEAPVHGGRQRGSLMFVQSVSADPDYQPRVAIAGTSSHLHPSDAGAMAQSNFPMFRDSGSFGISGNSGDVAAQGAKPVQFSGAFSPPSHSRSHSRSHSHSHKGLVPAEAEGAPERIEAEDPLSAGGSMGRGDEGKQRPGRSKRGSRSSRREGGGRSRRRSRDMRGGMRPAMPAAGPTDEMRPSPEPDDAHHPPGPWNVP